MAARSTSADFSTKHGKIGQQFQGKIVDAVKAKILKGFEGRGFSRAGDSGDDDQLLARPLLEPLRGLRWSARGSLSGCRL